MATWTDLKELRLKICDPGQSPDGKDIIDLLSVANAAALPATPARQTAYHQEDTGDYKVYDAASATWSAVDLLISDSRIEALIDAHGVLGAAPYAIKLILVSVGRSLGLARASGGAESVEFQRLADVYAFYKAIAAGFEEEAAVDSGTSSGLYLRTRHVNIAGGMHG